MTNNFLNMLNPQIQNAYQNLLNQTMQSGNPQQFLSQRYGNDPTFQQGMKIFNEQGMQGLQNFIASKLNNR